MATFSKLKSGEWGIKVEGSVSAGQSLTVTKKSGQAQTVTVKAVVWSGNGVSLCSIEPSGSKSKPGCCCNCGGTLSAWERSHSVRRCVDCRDGGGSAHGGQSYRYRNGNFVLGDDD